MEKLIPIPLEAAIEISGVPSSFNELKSLLIEKLPQYCRENTETMLAKIGTEALAKLLLEKTSYYQEIATAYEDVCRMRRAMVGMNH